MSAPPAASDGTQTLPQGTQNDSQLLWSPTLSPAPPPSASTAADRPQMPVSAGHVLSHPQIIQQEVQQIQSTAASQTPTASTGRRACLKENEKLILVSLCVEYGDKYLTDTDTNFWSFIKKPLRSKITKAVQDPEGMVKRLMNDYNQELALQQRESGTLQAKDSYLKQALAKWKTWMQRV